MDGFAGIDVIGRTTKEFKSVSILRHRLEKGHVGTCLEENRRRRVHLDWVIKPNVQIVRIFEDFGDSELAPLHVEVKRNHTVFGFKSLNPSQCVIQF
jgi:hypothetical protein